MTIKSQYSFSSGELAPQLRARADLQKYQAGLAKLRNMYVMKSGGATSRPGSEMVCEVVDSSKRINFVDFIFSVDQAYVLEFGNFYMRVLKNGVLLGTTHGTAVTGISAASPAVVTHTAHGYTTGDGVRLSGLTGNMAIYNGIVFTIETVNANTYKLKRDGSYVVSTGLTFAGTVHAEKIYKIATQYAEADLQTINYAQSNDVMTLTHPSYPVAELSRTGDVSWAFVIKSDLNSYIPSIARPTGLVFDDDGSGGVSDTYTWRVTAVGENGEESYPGLGRALVLSNMTRANPGVFTSTTNISLSGATPDHTEDGDEFIVNLGSQPIHDDDEVFKIDILTATTFSLVRADGTSLDTTTYAPFGGGTATKLSVSFLTAPSPSDSAKITWIQVGSPTEFNVYRKGDSGNFGYVGSVDAALPGGLIRFKDVGIAPDYLSTPPERRRIFTDSGDYPATVQYYQQRRMFAGSNNGPQTAWGSRTGAYNNFTISKPSQDDDSLEFDLVGKRAFRIKHLLDLSALVAFTSDGEFAIGSGDTALVPSNINSKQNSSNGCGDLAPLIVNKSALFVQAQGSIVRDLGYDVQNGLEGEDLTLYSSHLFEKYDITDWAFQQNPNSLVWATRDDGLILSLTYIREQQMLAWSWNDFEGGEVENVCCIPEGGYNRVYLLVKRTINNIMRRYIERLAIRAFEDITVDAKFLDSSVSYDGRSSVYAPGITITLSGGTTWDITEKLDLASSGALFNSDVGNEFHVRVGTELLRLTVVTDASNTTTHVKVKASKTVPLAFRGTVFSTWGRAVDRVEGLWHLEAKPVSIFGDGFVLANPNNIKYTQVVVAAGGVNISQCAVVIHVGLPFTSDVETLDIESAASESLVGKKINIGIVHMKLFESRGVFVGQAEPSAADQLSAAGFLRGLTEAKVRQYEGYDDPVALLTGTLSVLIKPEWKSSGRIFIRNTDPVPFTLLSVHPEGMIPARGQG